MRVRISLLIVFMMFLFISAPIMAQEAELPAPELTEVWEPVPDVVTPGDCGAPPSDAIVLFDGKDLSQWKHENGDAPKWFLNKEEGCFTVVKKTGTIETKQEFGDIQLHIEMAHPRDR